VPRIFGELMTVIEHAPGPLPPLDKTRQIPLLFLCSPNKIPLLAGISPLLGRVAESERKAPI
jgi:hypothetical protein